MKKEKHPIICTYKTTNNCNFPLVMIIGRESNNNIGYGHSVGHYDFCQFSSGGFWNSSYSFIAKGAEINNMEFKIIISKSANKFFFISNLTEWHFSCRKMYNPIWLKHTGGNLSLQEKKYLKIFKNILIQYGFEKYYLLGKNI